MRSKEPSPVSNCWTFLLIVGLFSCLYVLTLNAAFRVDDEHILAARTQSLAFRSELSEPQVYGNQRVQALIAMGEQATQIEPGQAILGAPLARLAGVSGLGSAQALFSLNIILTAFTAGVVFLIAKFLGHSQGAAIGCALFFGAGSIVWPYAMTYYRDPLAMVMSALAFLGLAVLPRTAGRRRIGAMLLISVGVLGGILAKNNVSALVPILIVVGVFTSWREARNVKAWKRWAIGSAAVLSILIALLLVPKSGALARFSPDYYLDLARHFLGGIRPSLLEGVLGPFVSPAKSVFLFSPPLLLVLIGMRSSFKRQPVYTGAAVSYAILLSLAQALFYREDWAGTFGWGLRSILPAFPALFPLLGPVLERVVLQGKRARMLALGGVLLISALIQVSGCVVPWHEVYLEWESLGLNPYGADAAWNVQFLAIPAHLARLLHLQGWSLVWMRLAQVGQWPGLIIPLVGWILGMVMLWSLRRIWSRRPLALGFLVALILSAMFLPLVPTWWAIARDPAWDAERIEFQEGVERVRSGLSGTDVLIVKSYGTPIWTFWMNRWHESQLWYSLPYEIPQLGPQGEADRRPSPEVEALLAELKHRYAVMWLISSDEAPDYDLRKEQIWLHGQGWLQNCWIFAGVARVEVCRFELQ